MGLFGSVQVVGIVCSIVRNKLVALWLGATGLGLFGLFNQALDMISTATALDMRRSSVRDISQALKQGDATLVARIVTTVRRWALWLGLAGALLTVTLAPVLSRLTFGTDRYVWSFVALAVAVLLMALSNGEQAVLQGLSKLNRLARVGLWCSLGGLAVSVPLFYWLREDSIVPSIVAYAACGLVAAWVLRDREYPHQRLTAAQTFTAGRDFMRLGVFMTVGSFVGILADYAFRAWLAHTSLAEVGFYNAGFTLFTKYTGLVFTALGMEFYPRLASVARGKLRVRVYLGQEIGLLLNVLVPFLSLFILLRTPIVRVLYSEEFVGIVTFVSWGLVGIVFKAVSWCLAFVILARGDGKVYLVVEALDALFGITLNITFYQLWGLNGLGASFVVWYALYTGMVAAVYFFRYRFTLSPWVGVHVAWATVVVALVMLLVELQWYWAAAGLTAAVIVISAYHFLSKLKLRGFTR